MPAIRTTISALLVATLLAGCSDDPYEDYCAAVTDNQEELTRILDEGGPDVLLTALPIFRELQESAPDDIRDDWTIVVTGLTSLQAALGDAGVDPATYDRASPPEDLSVAERDRIDAAAEELRTADSEAAFAAVEQQARDVCKTPLRL